MFTDEYAYQKARELEKEDVPFYALILAAMRKADGDNTYKLRSQWPEVWQYLAHRYNCTMPPCMCEVCKGAHSFRFTGVIPGTGQEVCVYCEKQMDESG